VLPVQFNIDYEWQTRKGFENEKRYSCYYRGDGWENESRSSCSGSWRVRSSKWIPSESIYLYSRTETPEKSEFMKRMAAANIAVPERFYCRVSDTVRKVDATYGCWDGGWNGYTRRECRNDGYKWKPKKIKSITTYVRCNTPSQIGTQCGKSQTRCAPSIALDGDYTNLAKGDVVSVPLAGVKASKTPVLFKRKENLGWDGTRRPWTVAGTPQSIRVDAGATNCPSAEEFGKVICVRTNKKSVPSEVIEHCSNAKNGKKLAELYPGWKKKYAAKKPQVLVSALDAIIALGTANATTHYERSAYLHKLGKKADALQGLKTANQMAKDTKLLLKIAELGKKCGSKELYKAALTKACSLGMKAACALAK